MKTLLKVYIWIMYLVALPVFLVFSTVIVMWNAIVTLKDAGEWCLNDTLKAYCEGLVIGHKINMARIEDIYSDDDGCKEEGL